MLPVPAGGHRGCHDDTRRAVMTQELDAVVVKDRIDAGGLDT
jgi:hypothetical protein